MTVFLKILVFDFMQELTSIRLSTRERVNIYKSVEVGEALPEG
jgi:hypothetical protein